MNDTIKKLAQEWKETDERVNKWSQELRTSKTAESKSVCFDALNKAWEYRSSKANVLAMAVAQELGL